MNRIPIAAIGLLLASLAMAGEPRYTDLVISEAKDGPAKSAFTTATPKIFLKAKLVDMPSGTKLRADWIAAKTKVAPDNYKIDSVVLTVGTLTNRADFSFSKPAAGWPVGDYRVELFVNDKPATRVPFKVQ